MFELSQYVPYLLHRAGRRLADALTPELARHDVALPMWRVLTALRNEGPRRLGALSRLVAIEVSTLSRLAAQMEEKDLVRRTRDGGDARAVTVSLTQRGLALTERTVPSALDCEQRALRGMSDAEVAILKRLLSQIHENLEDLMQNKSQD